MIEPRDVEIAHVLFMDVVAYSRLPIDRQTAALVRLQQTVRDCAEFRRAEAAGGLIRSPTGDGMALVFFGSPEAPARCAMEIADALRHDSELRLRIGIHTGPVYRVEDINAQANVAGGGINLAQRVMDCGDIGHILLSGAVADVLSQLSAWSGRIHPLGECAIKHGEWARLYNLYTDTVGNASIPSKLSTSSAPQPGSTAPTLQGAIALLYKRGAQPDEALLAYLERGLRARGYAVFIDRHLSVGVEWAREIERQIREAEVVVPLLSEAAISSEMLAYEIRTAHNASQERDGRPRILPVRLRYTGPLPEELASILDPLHYALWTGPAESERLLDELLRAIEGRPIGSIGLPPPPEPPDDPPRAVEAFGGAVPLNSRHYVTRATDEPFLRAISRRESLVLVKGPRQMGKTSLLARGLARARGEGARTLLTDFQKFSAPDLESAESFFKTLAVWVADQLELEVQPEDVWRPERSPSINFERYFRREVLQKLPGQLVWGMDEVDRLFTYPYTSDVFGLFRAWHNARATDPEQPWSRLTMAIAYATEAHLFITDMNQSPFNVGVRLTLEDFTLQEVSDLNRRSGSPLRGDSEVARFFRLVEGHPYLVRRGLYALAESPGLSAFEATADQDDGIYGDHLRRILVTLARDMELTDEVRGLLCGRPLVSQDGFYRLRSAGLVAGHSTDDVRIRCPIYASYLTRNLR